MESNVIYLRDFIARRGMAVPAGRVKSFSSEELHTPLIDWSPAMPETAAEGQVQDGPVHIGVIVGEILEGLGHSAADETCSRLSRKRTNSSACSKQAAPIER